MRLPSGYLLTVWAATRIVERYSPSYVRRGAGLARCQNTAGVPHPGPSGDSPAEPWDRVLAVNLPAHFPIIQQPLPHLTATRGNIVNLASSAASRGVPLSAAYSASKHGVV